jgi:spore maturation protein CgeB
LSSFPPEGRKNNSEKFISINFLGYAFLHSAFTADYELSGKKFKLFVIEGADQKECKDMIQKYLQQTKSPEKNIAEGLYTISDPYHGEIELHWQGIYLGYT